MTFDLIVRGGRIHIPEGIVEADVGIADERIVAIAAGLDGGRRELDARDRDVLPGAIDAHVHLNDPGRTAWEGFATGTAALAAGGTTCFADMPLNAIPPTLDGASLAAKRRAADGVAIVDFVLWGGLVPGALDRLDELAAGGVCGFKAFMSPSGVAEFEAADDLTLLEGMGRAARLGLPVAVHAESAALTTALAERAFREGRRRWRDYLDSRPVVAELEAIARAITLARETGCALHVVHVSTARGVELVVDARAKGVRVTCETCPHYLLLDEDDLERIGALAKCAPPLRTVPERDALRAAPFDLIASDHSPTPAALKRGDDAFAIWGGIAGAQTLLTGALTAGLAVAELPRLLGAAPADLLGIADRKGRIAVGLDADLVVVDPDAVAVLEASDLRYRHRHAPYVGKALRGRVERVILRGTVLGEGAPAAGRFIHR